MADKDLAVLPVFLSEPARPVEVPVEPSQPPADLHPGWLPILGPGERVIWHGAPSVPEFLDADAYRRKGFFGALAAALHAFRHSHEFHATRWQRHYLLTDRACYLARPSGTRLIDIRAFPITSTLQLGLGGRSVTFSTNRNEIGQIKAEGFLDITDSAEVYDMIREIQQARQ